jgi:hypothetical protein
MEILFDAILLEVTKYQHQRSKHKGREYAEQLNFRCCRFLKIFDEPRYQLGFVHRDNNSTHVMNRGILWQIHFRIGLLNASLFVAKIWK